jgi:hypothetical protein
LTPRTLAGIALSLALFAALAIFALNIILPARGNRFDFYPRYAGSQVFWRGESPYSETVTTQIQVAMFGDALPEEADQQRFAYPAYTAVLIAPFTLFPSDMATALWMALQIVALAWALSLWFDILDWKLPPIQRWVLIAIVLFAFRYPITLYLIAQFTGVIILCITLGIYFLLRRRDVLAGIFFAFATIQPTISAPLAGVILLAYGLRGRWKGLAAFLVTLGILVAITVARIGWWILDFLDNLRDYSRYATYYLWTPELFESPLIRVVFVAVVLLAAGWAAWQFLRSPRSVSLSPLLPGEGGNQRLLGMRAFLFTLILACLLLLPQTGSYYLMLLLPLLLASLQNVTQMQGLAKGLALLGFASALLIPWLYLLLPEETRQIEALLLPIHVWVVWIGTAWWARKSMKNDLSVGARHAVPLQHNTQP